MKKGFIYGLACPLTGQVRYVGQTQNPIGRRFRQHMVTKTTKISDWLVELSGQGLAPFPIILSVVALDSLDIEEQRWMHHFSAISELPPLLNTKNATPLMSIQDMGIADGYLSQVSYQKGLSNRDISDATGTSRSLVSQFCNGRRGICKISASRIVDFILS